MEIIIEYALLDNLIIDGIIIGIVYRLKKEKLRFWRLFFSSLFGSVCAILMPLLNCSNIIIIAIKLLIGLVMSLIAFKPSTFKKFLLDYFLFLSTTAVLGGIGIGILYLMFGSVSIDPNFAYKSPISLSAIYIIISAWCLGVISAIKFFYRKRNRESFVYEIDIHTKDSELSVKAYLDSGNTLIDPTTNRPVIIVGYKTFNKIYKDIKLENILLKKIEDFKIEGAHYIQYNTLNNQKTSMLICPLEKVSMKIDKKTQCLRDCVMGLSFSKFQKNFGCDVLLNQNCF